MNDTNVKLPKGYTPSTKEEYMNPNQLEYFRQKLTTWRDELVEEVEPHGGGDGDQAQRDELS